MHAIVTPETLASSAVAQKSLSVKPTSVGVFRKASGPPPPPGRVRRSSRELGNSDRGKEVGLGRGALAVAEVVAEGVSEAENEAPTEEVSEAEGEAVDVAVGEGEGVGVALIVTV